MAKNTDTVYRATKALFVGRARAYNDGDTVSAQQLKKHPEWEDSVEKVKVDEAPREPNIDEVLADVGDDKAKATAALEAEQAKDKPRSTLVEKLQAIVAS